MATKTAPPVRKKPSPRKSAVSAELSTSGASSTHWMTIGVLAVYAFASVISFVGLYAVGQWFLPGPYLPVALVGMVDLSIIIYKFGEIKLKQDPRKLHLAWKAKAGVLIGTVLSSAGNTVHIVQLDDPDPLRFWGSLLFAAASPWLIYLAASVLTDIIVKPKPKKVAPEPAAAPPAPVDGKNVVRVHLADMKRVEALNASPAAAFQLGLELLEKDRQKAAQRTTLHAVEKPLAPVTELETPKW